MPTELYDELQDQESYIQTAQNLLHKVINLFLENHLTKVFSNLEIKKLFNNAHLLFGSIDKALLNGARPENLDDLKKTVMSINTLNHGYVNNKEACYNSCKNVLNLDFKDLKQIIEDHQNILS